jgi:pimeloyl-ACP methyl ester carboxylesterase
LNSPSARTASDVGGRAQSLGVEIAYDDAGRGEPAVVLIHAPFGNRSHFAAVFGHLAKSQRVTYPLLFVHAFVPADLERLKPLRPDAVVASVAASGHFLTLSVPDQVNAMLDRFLAILPLAAEKAVAQSRVPPSAPA